MSLIPFITLSKLLGIDTSCKEYMEDSYEHKRCKKIQELVDQILKVMLENNQRLFQEYLVHIHQPEVIEFLKTLRQINNHLEYDIVIDMDVINKIFDDIKLEELSLEF